MQHELTLTDTLCAVELDVDDQLVIRRPDGRVQRLALRSASAKVARRGPLPYADREGVISYHIRCDLELDGRLVQLVRTIPSQENFRDPPTVDGLHIWLDATAGIEDFLTTHGTTACFTQRDCRLAIWQASQRICPPLLHPFCPLPEGALRLEQCYRGEDTWLGPYDGRECHGGLDINHPAGTPIWTPITIHEHELFGRVNDNANNNRWRGLHHWPDGKTWILQVHHITRLRVPEDQPIDAGVRFADGAGVLCGAHEHSHFVFDADLLIDPWLLFRQMYRDHNETRAR